MLIVVAVIAILATMGIVVLSRVDTQAKENRVKNAIAILSAALEQFRDYGYRYPSPYSDLDFPLDCTGFTVSDLQTALMQALGATTVGIVDETGAIVDDTRHPRSYSGSEMMYFFLSRVPECKATLDRVPASVVTDKGPDGLRMRLIVDGVEFPLIRVVDVWPERGVPDSTGRALRYDYYTEGLARSDPRWTWRTCPVITSAGPDGKFDTADDVTSE